MRKLALTGKYLLILTYVLLGSLLGIVSLYVYIMQTRADLQPWHTVHLQQEFTSSNPSDINSFEAYLSLENRLFEELQDKIYETNHPGRKFQAIRYVSGSLADPSTYDINWNRSFELKQKNARAGILLLHGLSDSPYSLRTIAKTLHKQGYYVLGLRLPGHGTIPSALVDTKWQDIAAAVKLAAHHLKQQTGPSSNFHIIGYSMGAAQAVYYSLEAIEDSSLPRAKSLILFSPAIGVSSAAALAIWQSRISAIPGLEKLAWNSIGPEYDPFKYVSFAVNAGDLMYRLTIAIDNRLKKLALHNQLSEFPPTLAFMSVVDATVSVPAVVESLFDVVSNQGNELVLFDLNRNKTILPFLKKDPEPDLKELMHAPSLNFGLSLLTNTSPDSLLVKELSNQGNGRVSSTGLGISWPDHIYSLSHIALPFSETDSLYGSKPARKTGLHIGLMAARGERGVVSIPAADMLRLKYNPFYDYLEQRSLEFLSQE